MFAHLPQHLRAEILEELARAANFANPLGKRLALFAAQQAAEFVLARDQFVANRVEYGFALLESALRPAGKRLARRVDGLQRLGRRRAGIAADDIAGIGRIHVFDGPVRMRPFAADVIGKGVVGHSGFRLVESSLRGARRLAKCEYRFMHLGRQRDAG